MSTRTGFFSCWKGRKKKGKKEERKGEKSNKREEKSKKVKCMEVTKGCLSSQRASQQCKMPPRLRKRKVLESDH
jgi:hypothetical protein